MFGHVACVDLLCVALDWCLVVLICLVADFRGL